MPKYDVWFTVRAPCGRTGLGSSEIPSEYSAPLVEDANGKVIGYIAYNGNIFAGSPSDWHSGTERLFDATGYYSDLGKRKIRKVTGKSRKRTDRVETQVRGIRK